MQLIDAFHKCIHSLIKKLLSAFRPISIYAALLNWLLFLHLFPITFFYVSTKLEYLLCYLGTGKTKLASSFYLVLNTLHNHIVRETLKLNVRGYYIVEAVTKKVLKKTQIVMKTSNYHSYQ